MPSTSLWMRSKHGHWHTLPLVLAGLSAYVLSACGADRHAPRSAQPAGAFSVFAQQANADDVVPQLIDEALEQSVQPEFTRSDIAAARRVLPDDPVWLVPAANGELCMARLKFPLVASFHGTPLPTIPAIVCAGQAAALAGRLVVTQSLALRARTATAPTRVIGVVPDGASRVRVIFRHGKAMSVEARRNGYELILDDPERIQFQIRRTGKLITETVPLVTPSFGNTTPSHSPGEAF